MTRLELRWLLAELAEACTMHQHTYMCVAAAARY